MKIQAEKLYQDCSTQQARYEALAGLLPAGRDSAVRYFSAPGRTELGGNHTDHQNGHVLAGAVNVDMAAAVTAIDEPVIRVLSKGYAPICVSLAELDPAPSEAGSSAALVRGIASYIVSRGYSVGGFALAMDSAVPPGSGLSSSAAFEVLIGTVINALFCGDALSAVEIAQIGQWAENVYFEKPCGLMDQLACSVGGVAAIDLREPKTPVIHSLPISLEQLGYRLAIIRCGGDHADLTDDYGAIPQELGRVASIYGKHSVLELDRARVLRELPKLREAAGDRAILRMFHVWSDDARATEQADALAQGDVERYLRLVRESGESSWMYLQNVISSKEPERQSLGLTLALCRQLLGDRGAYRVHGGGFAGTTQAYVPLELTEAFRSGIDAVLGEGACIYMNLRPYGGVELSF